MWNYVKLHSDNSPMAEILSKCGDKSNLRLVVYHLSENHVECATTPNADREYKLTNEVAHEIGCDARNGVHAILAFDVEFMDVFLIDSVPELQIASAVLLCVVTELLNGCVQPRQCECGRPTVRREAPHFTPSSNFEEEVVRRDAKGRFVRKTDEPWKDIPETDGASSVMHSRFSLGNFGRH